MDAAMTEQSTVYPDSTIHSTREEVQRQVEYLKAQLNTEVNGRRREEEKHSQRRVDSSIHALRGELTCLVDSRFIWALTNGTILGMITDTIERALASNPYLHNLATAL